jgi:hypothetical protein
MGMKEITQSEHMVIMMSLLPKLTVKRLCFTANQGETVDEYRNRCRVQMAEILGIACSETGFRDEAELNDMRKKQN